MWRPWQISEALLLLTLAGTLLILLGSLVTGELVIDVDALHRSISRQPKKKCVN